MTIVNDREQARNRTIATVARRLAKTTQLDFHDAMIEAQTAVWLVERRPSTDTDQHGFKSVADHAYLEALHQIEKDEGFVQGSNGKRRRVSVQWPVDLDVESEQAAPDRDAEWAAFFVDFMDQVRDSIRRVDPTAVWVVDAVENGYRYASELKEWSRRFGFDYDRRECKRVYDLFYRHSRSVMSKVAEEEGEDF